jgi:hypothetical protein
MSQQRCRSCSQQQQQEVMQEASSVAAAAAAAVRQVYQVCRVWRLAAATAAAGVASRLLLCCGMMEGIMGLVCLYLRSWWMRGVLQQCLRFWSSSSTGCSTEGAAAAAAAAAYLGYPLGICQVCAQCAVRSGNKYFTLFLFIIQLVWSIHLHQRALLAVACKHCRLL